MRASNLARWFAAAVVFAGFSGGTLLVGQAPAQQPKPRSNPEYKRRVGEPLPDFQLTDLQGKTWRLADLKGKVTFINVWASW